LASAFDRFSVRTGKSTGAHSFSSGPQSGLHCIAYTPCASNYGGNVGVPAVVPLAGAAGTLPPFCARVNAVGVYAELNRYLARTYAALTPIKVVIKVV
jgi:hypothetical protein